MPFLFPARIRFVIGAVFCRSMSPLLAFCFAAAAAHSQSICAGWIRDTVGDTDLAEALRPYAEKETVTGRQLSNIRPIIRARLDQYKEVLPDLDSYKTSPPLY